MKKMILAGCAAAAIAIASPAWAQGMSDAPVGKQAGTLMVRLRAIGVIPLNSDSSLSVGGDNIGKVSADAAVMPEVDLTYFITDNIAVEAIAATTRHKVTAELTGGPDLKVGHIWVLPPTVTLQYHFAPKARFSPYIGAGVNVSFFYGSSTADGFDKLTLNTGVGPALQVGFDYNISGRWFLNVDYKQIFVHTNGKAGITEGPTVKAKSWLNPAVVGVGIGYRF